MTHDPRSHYPRPIEYEQRPADEAEALAFEDLHLTPPRLLSTPSHFLAAALVQRRRELGDPDYIPYCPPYNRNKERRPAHVFDEVYEEIADYVESPHPQNLGCFLDPRHWNLNALAGPKPAGNLLDTSADLFITRSPRLGLRTTITQRGHLYVIFYLPDPEDESDPEGADFLRFFFPYGTGGWDSPEPDEVLKVRYFRELMRHAVGGPGNKLYLRSAKLLALCCYSYLEWVAAACQPTLDVRRDRALYLTLEDGPEGEREIKDFNLVWTADVARDLKRAAQEAERHQHEAWRAALPSTYGFTAEQAASAYLRAGGVVKAAHRIVLESITSDEIKKPSYASFLATIARLRDHFPELFQENVATTAG